MDLSRLAGVLLLIGAVGTGTAACSGSSAHRAPHSGVFPSPGDGSLPAATVRALNRAFGTDVRDADSDLTVAVVTSRGTWQAATGKDGEGRALRPDDDMAVGSISKTFTAAEIMHLADEHRIDLDAPLSRYVSSPLLVHAPTVRQVLSMRSGIDPGPADQGAVYSAQEKLAEATPDGHASLARVLTADTVRPGPPGPFRYCNTGFELLAEAVQRVTGQPLATAIDDDLLRPAGLHRTVVQDGQRPPAPLAYGFDSAGGRPRTDGYLPNRAIASAVLGAGSVASDAPDIARWGYELYGSRVLPRTDVTQLATPIGTARYGLATIDWRHQFSTHDTVGHDGFIRGSGHSGFVTYSSLLVVDRTSGVSIALLSPDIDYDGETPLVRDLLAALPAAR